MFRGEPLLEILAYVEAELAAGATMLELRVLDPDLGRGLYAGERVDHAGAPHVHRPFRVWVDLAERLGLRLATPRAAGDGLIDLRLERIEPVRRPVAAGTASADDPRGGVNAPALPPQREQEGPLSIERYGQATEYARVAKLEDPGFVLDLGLALARARLGPAPRVLDLGVNTGDELRLIERAAPGAHGIGVDHSASALAEARRRFPMFEFREADLGALADLGLGRFDLVVSLNTLQSAGIDDRAVLRQVVQEHLAPGGAVILGLPNSRYAGGEVSYGARMKNFREPELGLLIKDVAFYRKYLQQHDRQVFVTGKHYLLVTGVAAKST